MLSMVLEFSSVRDSVAPRLDSSLKRTDTSEPDIVSSYQI